jgi:hypothetical protein
MDIHLVPPHNHRVNAAERAIATFKEHFISALATVDKNCPLQLWDDFLPQVELTLNLLRFSRRDPTKSANEEVNGKFDYNKTPLAPLGTKELVYEDPANRASWAPHGTDAYYVGPAPKHYRCLRFYMPITRRYRVADTWRLYPTHCTTPKISATERTIIQATDTLTALGGTVPSSTSEAIARSHAIQKLRDILLPSLQQTTPAPPTTVTPSPRVLRPRIPAAPEPRVPATSPSPRVLRAATRNNPPPPTHNPTRTPTTSHDPTAPPNVRLVRPIHQRHTRSNNPFVILEDDTPDDEDEDIADDITVHASNQRSSAPFSPFIRRMLEPPPQHTVRTQAITSPAAPTVHDLRPSNKPTANPTAFPPRRCIQSVSPQRVLRSTLPATKKPTPLPQLPSPHYIPPDTDTRVHKHNRATRIVSTRNPASITMHALYHVINLAFNNPPGYTIPKNLIVATDRFQHNINIDEVCNGVVHPITKETITKYTKLMDDPALKDLWVPAMSKELHRLAQGKEGVTVGTNTIFYLTHDEIRRIPKDRTVTYARIVIDHRPQKDDPN